MPDQSTVQKLDTADTDVVVRQPKVSEPAVVHSSPTRQNSFALTDHVEKISIRGMPIHSLSLRQTVEILLIPVALDWAAGL